MQNFHNILYVCRGIDDETDGLQQALDLTSNNQASLKILILTPDLPKSIKDYKEKYESSIIEDTSEALSKIASDIGLDLDALDVSFQLENSPTPGTAIVKLILKNDYDLVIKEAQAVEGKGGFKALDMELLRKCPCPVWLCRPFKARNGTIKIAVAIDPDSEEIIEQPLSIRMLKLARSLAEKTNGELNIISCWEYEYEETIRNSIFIKMDPVEVDKEVAKAENANKSGLETLIKNSGIKENHQVFNIKGKPGQKIPAFVQDKDIDILIMGTLGRTGIAGLIIGNTAENIIQNLSCSLIALKPKGFVSTVKV